VWTLSGPKGVTNPSRPHLWIFLQIKLVENKLSGVTVRNNQQVFHSMQAAAGQSSLCVALVWLYK
jgi:hypothetical protein